jgi:hypothetical protein
MRHLRFVARISPRLLLAISLGLTGCSDEPNLPANVEEAARRRAQEEQQTHEELERDRQRVLDEVKRETGAADSPDGIPNAENEATDTNPAAPADGNAIPDASTEISDSLTDTSGKSSEPPAPPTPPITPRDRTTRLKWSQMKAGMTPAEVHKLLGPPTRQSQDFFLTYWYYGTGQRAGKVAFISQSQRTMAWDMPLE